MLDAQVHLLLVYLVLLQQRKPQRQIGRTLQLLQQFLAHAWPLYTCLMLTAAVLIAQLLVALEPLQNLGHRQLLHQATGTKESLVLRKETTERRRRSSCKLPRWFMPSLSRSVELRSWCVVCDRLDDERRSQKNTIAGCSQQTSMLAMVLEQTYQLSVCHEKLFSDVT